MRRTLRLVALALLQATAAEGQRRWTPELGIQGGFSRVKPSGTGQTDHADLFDLPGFGLAPAIPSYASLYAIVPLKSQLALEPSIAASQISAGGAGLSLVNLGLRINYALTPKFYGAIGGTLGYESAFGSHETQIGLQLAAGYRLRLTPTLNGRVEANWITTGDTDDLPAANAYSLLFGVSTRLTGAAPAPARGRARAPARAWQPALGIAGGYANVHVVDQGDIATMALPGLGGGLAPGGIPVVTPPTLFAIIPIGAKLALEPGIDIHRIQDASNAQTDFSGNYSARLNYAVSGGWYGAAGANVWHIVSTGSDAVTVFGGNLAWGYRFHLTGALGGRVELNYTMFPQNDDIGQASNTFGLMFGTTMPLK